MEIVAFLGGLSLAIPQYAAPGSPFEKGGQGDLLFAKWKYNPFLQKELGHFVKY